MNSTKEFLLLETHPLHVYREFKENLSEAFMDHTLMVDATLLYSDFICHLQFIIVIIEDLFLEALVWDEQSLCYVLLLPLFLYFVYV